MPGYVVVKDCSAHRGDCRGGGELSPTLFWKKKKSALILEESSQNFKKKFAGILEKKHQNAPTF